MAKTLNMVILSLIKLKNVSDPVTRVINNGTTVPYVPVAQRAETFMRLHWNFGHTQTELVQISLCINVVVRMQPYIDEILEQCEVCKKVSPSTTPPKLSQMVLYVGDFQKWGLGRYRSSSYLK